MRFFSLANRLIGFPSLVSVLGILRNMSPLLWRETERRKSTRVHPLGTDLFSFGGPDRQPRFLHLPLSGSNPAPTNLPKGVILSVFQPGLMDLMNGDTWSSEVFRSAEK